MKNLAVAWLASSAAFVIAFIGFMALWVWLDERTFRPPLSYLRLGAFAFGAALVVQFVYGGLVYFILTRIGLWNIWTVTLAYLLPVGVIAWLTVDTVREGVGTIAWLMFACIVAAVFWFFAPASVKAD
jgi:hypothetical protein